MLPKRASGFPTGTTRPNHSLCVEQAKDSAGNIARLNSPTTEQRLKGSQRELGIIGILALRVAVKLAKCRHEVRWGWNILGPHPFKWGTKGIADCTAKQATDNLIASGQYLCQ
jgi:hypothetical protein